MRMPRVTPKETSRTVSYTHLAMGARPLRREMQLNIEDALSEQILFGDIKPGEKITVDAVSYTHLDVYQRQGKARPHHSVRAGLAPSAPPQRLSTTRRAAGLSTGVNHPEAPPGAGEYT